MLINLKGFSPVLNVNVYPHNILAPKTMDQMFSRVAIVIELIIVKLSNQTKKYIRPVQFIKREIIFALSKTMS